MQQYGQLLASVDAWFNRSISLATAGIACKEGCSGCCRGLFDITLLDACYLKQGFDRLDKVVQGRVLEKVSGRLAGARSVWPEFASPYILNYRPDEEWGMLMPEEDETPCVLLGEDGRCLVYDHRPMTCRLHGLPLVDLSGEVMDDQWCTMNFINVDPLQMVELRYAFVQLFETELSLFQLFTVELLTHKFNELDTLIPAALLLDFDAFDWEGWGKTIKLT